MNAERQFEEACRRHDLTYDYSDDGDVWRRGCASLDKIHEMAKALPPDRVAEIWNRIVDTKIIEGHRECYYWREAKP